MTAICKSTLVLTIMFGSLMRAGGQTVLEPENQQVALAGELREVHGYGAPGYGENKKVDAPITYWVLELPNPINTICKPEKPQWEAEDCQATKRLKLFFPSQPANNGLEAKAKALKGRRVLATGILHRADTIGEITPIYMDVAELQPVQAPPKPCPPVRCSVRPSFGAALLRLKGRAAFGIGCRHDTSPQNGSCPATCGCCAGTC